MTSSRRGLLAGAGGFAALAGGALGARPAVSATALPPVVPFHGANQAGIVTPQQSHTYFLALDLLTSKRDDVAQLLRTWTDTSASMASGETAAAPDSSEALGLPPSRLTVTIGLGAGLFQKDGHDRYGLAAQRPPALIDLPT